VAVAKATLSAVPSRVRIDGSATELWETVRIDEIA
jgi:hypothetical protein